MNTLSFNLPALTENGPIPFWNGQMFVVGDQTHKILEYSENFQGWNDGLTQFVEIHAGENHAIDLASRQNTLTQIKLHSPVPHPILLEVGCSSGFMLKEFRKAFPNAILMGADIVREPLLSLYENLPNVPLFRFDLTTCPLPDNSIDIIVLLNILEHIENDVAALQQVFRILKPGGVAIIEVPAGPHLFDLYDKLLLHFRRYSLKDLAKLAKQIGFSIVQQSHLGCLVYPAFSFVKKRNKRLFDTQNESEQRKAMEKNIKHTKENFLLGALMNLELLLSKFLEYPFGIRCLLTLKKPSYLKGSDDE